ncbi:MAG: hypothetical protein ACXW30_06710 [Micavibrio sp.]
MQDNDLNPAAAPDEKPGLALAAPAPKKPNKWLTAAFNMASGAVVSLAIKTTIVACATPFLSPVVTIGVAAVAAGVASSYTRHYFENRALKKAGQEPVKFTFKKATFGAGFGLLGAGLAAGAVELFEHFFGADVTPACPEKPADVQPAAGPVEPAPATTPAPEDCPCPPVKSPLDCVKDMINGGSASDRVKDTMDRIASANPRVSAQGVKDLGYFLFNGFDGMPKDPCLAVQLLKEAAEQGNIQAKVDLAYIEYHGNAAAGIEANKEAALEKMKELGSNKARWFVEQWTGGGTDAPQASLPANDVAPVQPVTGTVAPVVEPVAPAPAGETLQSGPGLDYQAVINTDTNNIDFVISVPENDNSFVVGEKVNIQRPGLLQLQR